MFVYLPGVVVVVVVVVEEEEFEVVDELFVADDDDIAEVLVDEITVLVVVRVGLLDVLSAKEKGIYNITKYTNYYLVYIMQITYHWFPSFDTSYSSACSQNTLQHSGYSLDLGAIFYYVSTLG